MELNKIKLVIWDLDETFWEGTLSEGNVATPTNNVKLIKDLTDCGIINSICSKNNETNVLPELEKLGLSDYFVFKSINWESKGLRVASLIKNMSLRPANVLFIDDNHQNLKEVEFYNEGIMVAFPKVITELIDYVALLDKKDPEHKRLKQYQVLQTKWMESQSYNDNDEFLRSCNIHIEFMNDCLENIDRLHELLLRTNQLNYTKQRPTKEEFELQLKEEGVECGYVKVHDRFGDYGVVGFYLLKDDKLQHFLFSCRTIGQSVEQYVYAKLGYPQLEVVEPVATQLDKSSLPDWITEGEITIKEETPIQNGEIQVLFKGPCDMQGMVGYLQMGDGIDTEFTFTNDYGKWIESHNHSAHISGLVKWNDEDKKRIESECPFMSKDCYHSNIFNKNYDIIFLSTLIEGMYGLYRNKSTGDIVAFGHYLYPLTDSDNWDKYISKEYETYGFEFSLDSLDSFSKKYEFIGRTTPKDYITFLNFLIKRIGSNTKLCLILGSETPYLANIDKSYSDRHIFHKELNEAIIDFASKNEKVILLNTNDYIKQQSDFTNNINHFTPTIYYKMSLKMLEIIRESSNAELDFKINRKRYFINKFIQPWVFKLLPFSIYKFISSIGKKVSR